MKHSSRLIVLPPQRALQRHRQDRMKTFILLLIVIPSHVSLAGSRTSANYGISADITDTAGQPAASASYSHDGSAGGVVGVSTATASGEKVKAGYISQLYDVVGFALSDAHSSVPENSTLQLEAGHLLDDATLLAISPALVNWHVVSGPVTSISTNGLAAAGTVYEDTSATVQGSFGVATASLNLTVFNVNSDDFDSYAGDGIGDEWQVQYFGLPPNPLAGPLLDPDGDTQDNLFEWNAGLDPTDTTSVFNLRTVRIPQGLQLIFSPILPGHTYTVKYGYDLLQVPDWPELPLNAIAVTDIVTENGLERRVTDSGAPFNPRKFYRVEIGR